MYLAALGILWVWFELQDNLNPRPIQKVINFLDFKPFNCSLCLSFWVGVILTAFYEPYFLSIPPAFYILRRVTFKL